MEEINTAARGPDRVTAHLIRGEIEEPDPERNTLSIPRVDTRSHKEKQIEAGNTSR